MDRITSTPPQAVGAVGLGMAVGIIATWALGFAVDVPAEVGTAIGSVFVFIAGRFIAE